jgi:hypothetical protein
MRAPPANVAVSHFAGTALSGPRPVTGAVAATPAVVADVEWLAIERMPSAGEEGLLPLGASARLVIATRDRQPVWPTIRLTAGAQWAKGDSAGSLAAALGQGRLAGQVAPLSSARVAIPVGATVSLRATTGNDAGPNAAPAVELFLQHLPAAGVAAAANANAPRPGALELALAVQDFAIAASEVQEPAMNAPAEPKGGKNRSGSSKSPPPAAPRAKPPATPSLSRELVILPPLDASVAGIVAVIVMPSRFVGSPARGFAAIVRASPATDNPATQQLLAAAVADVRRQADAARGARPGAAPTSAAWPEYQPALSLLDRADVRRRAMVYLAAQTGAELCQDIALTADDPTLQQLATEIRARAVAATGPFTSQSLGWMLDRTCLEWAVRLAGENRLPPEMAGMLSTYAGEAGRRAASLEEMLRSGIISHDSLNARLISENLIYLDDSSPAARVRALEWLAARGRAPAGYDPLGPSRQRRDALERAMEDAARAATRPATRPAP